MSDLLFALGATAATAACAAVMWVVCLRPMRRQRRTRPGTDTAAAERAELRREVASLRDQPGAR